MNPLIAGIRRYPGLSAWTLALLGLVVWSDWSALRSMTDRWMNDPRYSHGFLVPMFSVYLLWRRREVCPEPLSRPSPWGLAILLVAAAVQIGGALIFLGWLEGAAFVLALGGLVTLWGGPKGLRWALPSLIFLLFMIPLPHRVETALGGPLQTLGTVSSTFTLQTLGLPAIAEGNIIRLDDKATIAVVEACNGLGMLAAFACYATAAVILLEKRDLATRLILLVSSIPLALLANITRIVVTGVAHATLGGSAADLVFHDLAGWLMMPLALGLLWGELMLLSALIVENPRGSTISSLLEQGLANPAGGSRS